MKNFNSDSSSALSRFAKDKRLRTDCTINAVFLHVLYAVKLRGKTNSIFPNLHRRKRVLLHGNATAVGRKNAYRYRLRRLFRHQMPLRTFRRRLPLS